MACRVLSALLPTYYYSLPLWHIVVMAYLYWRSSRSFLLHLLLPASLLEFHENCCISSSLYWLPSSLLASRSMLLFDAHTLLQIVVSYLYWGSPSPLALHHPPAVHTLDDIAACLLPPCHQRTSFELLVVWLSYCPAPLYSGACCPELGSPLFRIPGP